MRYVKLINNVIIQFNNLREIGQLYYAVLLYFFENKIPDRDNSSIIQAQSQLKFTLKYRP